MNTLTTPAVVLKSKFVLPSSNEYSDYINYIDRDEAKVKQQLNVKRNSEDMKDFYVFHSFMGYMDDEEKQGELFTHEYDSLSEKMKSDVKEDFMKGQKNGSPMWQDVISFDNVWLEEQGLYHSETKKLNEEKIKRVVRGVMKDLLKAEKMEDSAVWIGSIHQNTDNIHVHIATIEPQPTREKVKIYDKEKDEWIEQYRARRKQGSLNRMKSRVVNSILDRTEQYNKIDELIRGTVQAKRNQGANLSKHKKTKDLFFKALENMPDDLRQWKYGYQSINKARPYIDEMVEIYLDTYHKEDMEKLDKLLDEQVETSKRLYGENSKYEQYKENQLKDLQKRMGNAVLTEMRNYVKDERQTYFRFGKKHSPVVKRDMNRIGSHRFRRWQRGSNLHYSFVRLTNALRKTFHEYEKERNIDEFDRMMER